MGKKELSAILTLKDQLSPQLKGVQGRLKVFGDEVKRQLKGVQGRLKVFGDEVKRLAKVGFIALTAAITATTVALTKLIKSSVDYGIQLDKIAKQTGITTEEMSKLQYAAEQEHASVESITKALPILAKYMEYARQGMETYRREFDKMGISVTTTGGRLKSTYEILLEMADFYEKATNKTEALAIATTLLGRRGAELVPLLSLGRSGIEDLGSEAEKLGIVMDQKTAAGMKVFGDSILKLQKAVQGIGIAITEVLLPYLVTLTDNLGKLDFGKIREEVRETVESLINFGAFLSKWALGIKLTIQILVLAFSEIMTFVITLGTSTKILFLEISNSIKQHLVDLLSKIQNFVNIAGPILKVLGIDIADGLSGKIAEGIDALNLSIETTQLSISEAKLYLEELGKNLEDQRTEIEATAEAMANIDGVYQDMTRTVKNNSKALIDNAATVRTAQTAITDLDKTVEGSKEEFDKMKGIVKTWAEGVQTIGTTLGKAMTHAMDGISTGVASSFRDMLETGENFGDSMRKMFNKLMFDILEEILASQIKQAFAGIFDFMGGLGGGKGLWGMLGTALSWVGGFFFGHHGGTVTPQGVKRFHGGGWPGLRNDEVPIIAQTGERILNRQESSEYERKGNAANNYYITINAVDAQSFAMLVKRNPESIISVVGENMSRNGSLRSISRATA